MEIIIEKQDNSIRRLDHVVIGHFILLGLLLYATIINSFYSNWLYSLISGVLSIILIKKTYSTLITFSYPKLYLNKTEINIKYFKFGFQIASKSIKKKDIIKCYILDNTNWFLQGFSIILKTKKDTVEIGLALINDDAKLIEKKIKNWL